MRRNRILWGLAGIACLIGAFLLGLHQSQPSPEPQRVEPAAPKLVPPSPSPPPAALEHTRDLEEQVERLQRQVRELEASVTRRAPAAVAPPAAGPAPRAAPVVDAGVPVAVPPTGPEPPAPQAEVVPPAPEARMAEDLDGLAQAEAARVQRRAAVSAAVTQLNLADAQLVRGNTDGVAAALDQAEQAFSGEQREEIRAARASLANEDLAMTREHLAAALLRAR